MVVPAEIAKIDITKHVLVPKHILLSEEEAKKLLSQLNISAAQLPSILSTDPMAKALGAKVGNIIKIERIGPSGKSAYYRRVI
ncbi:MAG: DNA-directed RNA polymerase subunit H [Candidatus Nanoarchaeia archaeon]